MLLELRQGDHLVAEWEKKYRGVDDVSRGSAVEVDEEAKARVRRLDTNPFFFRGSDLGCLLIHGFTGSPAEMRGMGGFLAHKGLTILGVRLVGHGTTPSDLVGTTWQDWVASAEKGLRDLTSSCSQVFIAGLSLGGVIALHLAAHHQIQGVIVMATPVHIRDWRFHLLPLMKLFVKWVSTGDEVDLTNPAAADQIFCYHRIPTSCADGIRVLLQLLKRELPLVKVPVLVMQGTHDRTVPLDSAPYIMEHLGSEEKILLWFRNSGHCLTVDSEKEQVWQSAYEFIAQHKRR